MPDVNPSAPPLPWCVKGDLRCSTEGVEDAVVDLAIAAASELLWSLTGHRFGLWTITETDRAELQCGPVVPWRMGYDGIRLGEWHYDARARNDLYVLTLGQSPVQAVTAVTTGAVELVSNQWRVDDWRKLVRVDGAQWAHPTTVTYRYGLPIPTSGVLAAAELACEVLKALQQDQKCKLPARVQQISRGGVTIPFLDPMDFLQKGLTGLILVDLFITSVNPEGLRARSRILNPDDYAAHQRGT